MDRREFCRVLAVGTLGLGAGGLFGCKRVLESSVRDDSNRPYGILPNTDQTLTLPSDITPFGLHPSLIDFRTEHGRDSWGGYRYWLCWTPYWGLETELPTLAASNDLVTWTTPKGLPNPITKAYPNGTGSMATCNDPEICFDPDANSIHLYHSFYNAGTLLPDLSDRTYFDGGRFTYRIFEDGRIDGKLFEEGPPFTSLYIAGAAGGSPIVHREANGKWHMWEGSFSYRSSKDGLHWSEPSPCTLGTPDAHRSTTLPSYMRGWTVNHSGGKYVPSSGWMEFATSCVPPSGVGGAGENLAMFACDLTDPTALYVMLDDWLLTHREPGKDWDGGSTYRSVLMPHPEDPDKRRLVYSAFRYPCTANDITENHISSVVEGDISANLLAETLPRA